MKKVKLVPHHIKFAERMSRLTSSPRVKEPLGLNDEQTSLEGTKQFIHFILQQEVEGKQYSRCMVNENDELIGVITLKDMDPVKKTSHIGTWIGDAYWGQGYNQLAKEEMLYRAFVELGLEYVFAGAKVDNIRSQKAQEKLPYITLHVGDRFPEELHKLEAQVKAECCLHVIEREKFLMWHKSTRDGAGS